MTVTSENITLRLGDFEVIRLVDAVMPFPIPAQQAYSTVPTAEWKRIRQQYASSFYTPTVLVGEAGCFLIRRPGQTILVDTGLGANHSFVGEEGIHGQLLTRLAEAGATPDAVDTIILTHLHPDHVGWNIQQTGDNQRPTFPRARYIAPQADWEMGQRLLAENPERAAHVREQVRPLQQWGLLSLISAETTVADGVCLLPTPGHSPGHMSVLVEANGGQGLLLAGDAFFHPLQVGGPAHAFAGDTNAELAYNSRTRLLERIEAADLILTAAHFPAPGFGHVRQDEGGRYWQPVG
jgi:glyoxylase-like metal-dependent hydrolase (beta-lactamase superfamily II)